jgi:hypothetical protein
VPEVYRRYGDVVELYAYTAPVAASYNQRFQVLDLSNEKPFPISDNGPWAVTARVDSEIGTPRRCLVAVQSTHALMTAGNAY